MNNVKGEPCPFCRGAGYTQAMPLVMGALHTRCVQRCIPCNGRGYVLTETIEYAEAVNEQR